MNSQLLLCSLCFQPCIQSLTFNIGRWGDLGLIHSKPPPVKQEAGLPGCLRCVVVER